MRDIDLSGVRTRECPTDFGDYYVEFYPRDHKRNEIRNKIHERGYKVVHRESCEGGEHVTWFVEEDV